MNYNNNADSSLNYTHYTFAIRVFSLNVPTIHTHTIAYKWLPSMLNRAIAKKHIYTFTNLYMHIRIPAAYDVFCCCTRCVRVLCVRSFVDCNFKRD